MSISVLYTMPNNQDSNHMFGMQSSSGYLSFLFPEEKAQTPKNRIYLSVVSRGSAIIEINGKNHKLDSGTLIYLQPDLWVKQISCTDDFLFECIWFELDFLSDFPLLLRMNISEYACNDSCLRLKEEDYKLVEKYYSLIVERFIKSDNPLPIIKGLLFSLVLEVGRLYSRKNISALPTRQSELVDCFFSLLHQYFRKEHFLSFYADKMCISDKYLMRVLKEVTGHSFHFWIMDSIIRDAKLLLRSTALSISEISVLLNYPNSSLFSRVFRKHVGMTPSDFRHQ